MIETTDPDTRRPGIPRWLQSVTGITVFLAILATVLYGTGFFQGETNADNSKNGKPVLTPSRVMIFARDRGDWPRAEQACRELIRLDRFDARARFNLGYALHQQNRLEEAAEQYRISRDFLEYRSFSLYNLACIDALLDRPDDALEKLDTAINEGFVSRQGIAVDPDFSNLKDDPEFQRLVLMESLNRDKRDARN